MRHLNFIFKHIIQCFINIHQSQWSMHILEINHRDCFVKIKKKKKFRQEVSYVSSKRIIIINYPSSKNLGCFYSLFMPLGIDYIFRNF